MLGFDLIYLVYLSLYQVFQFTYQVCQICVTLEYLRSQKLKIMFFVATISTGRGSFMSFWQNAEAGIQRCSVKNLFLEISQNSHGNTCDRASFEFIFKNSCFKTPTNKRTSKNMINSSSCFSCDSFQVYLWLVLCHSCK